MSMDSDEALRAQYGDVLEDCTDERRLQLVRHLDAGYSVITGGLMQLPPRAQEAPVELWLRTSETKSRMRQRAGRAAPGWSLSRRGFGWHLGIPAFAVLALVMCVTLAIAASAIFYLGKPTNATSPNPNFPLSGFHKSGPFLRSHGLPELLWLGTAWPGDAASDWERWPVIKALSQFGTFSNVLNGRQTCVKAAPNGEGGSVQPFVVAPCSIPTADWSGAHYRSQYVVFIARDLIDKNGRAYEHLNSMEARVFNRYVRQTPGSSASALAASINIFNYGGISYAGKPGGSYPLLSVSGYVQTVSQIPFVGDVASTDLPYGVGFGIGSRGLPALYYYQTLSPGAVRSALVTGKTPSVPAAHSLPGIRFPSLVPDINAEANVITALICHADGKKPGAVCGRTVIKSILKRVR